MKGALHPTKNRLRRGVVPHGWGKMARAAGCGSQPIHHPIQYSEHGGGGSVFCCLPSSSSRLCQIGTTDYLETELRDPTWTQAPAGRGRYPLLHFRRSASRRRDSVPPTTNPVVVEQRSQPSRWRLTSNN